eukprot:1129606-Rhodomonas_salina.6
MGVAKKPANNPMSWNHGIQDKLTELLSNPESTPILFTFFSASLWVTTTPLGDEVDPLVYCRYAMSSGSNRTSVISSKGAALRPSMHSNWTAGRRFIMKCATM